MSIKPGVLLKLEDSDLRLALATPDCLFGKEPLGYIPWLIHDGQKSYDFGFNNIRSRPTADVLGWKCSSQIENHIYHKSNLKAGIFEWFGPDDLPTVTIKWTALKGCLVSVEKVEAWIQHWSFKTWAVNISPEEKSAKAQEIGRWYWEVRKNPSLVYKLVEKAHSKCAKPQRSVEDVMSHHKDRFHEAHKWDWYYGGCSSDDMQGVFKDFRVYCDAPLTDQLNVPGVGLVGLKPHGWASVPPFLATNVMPKPVRSPEDREPYSGLSRIPVARVPKARK